MLQGVVFDFDGLIADTEWPEYRAVAEQFELRGLSFPPEAWAHVIGSSWKVDWISDLEQRLGQTVDRQAVLTRHAQRKAELRVGLRPLPGVLQLLDAVAEAGLRVAVASSSPRSWVEPRLEELALRSYFPIIRTLDDVSAAKPAPELFLAACHALGIEPARAVALEDSANGATAAKAAGMRCIAVPNRLTKFLDLSHADVVLDSLEEVTIEFLTSLVQD